MTPHRRFNLITLAVYMTALFILVLDMLVWAPH
jgi:hypothetical protein